MEELVHRGRKKINGNSTINVKYYLLSRNFFFMLIVHPIKHCVTFVYVWNNDKNADKVWRKLHEIIPELDEIEILISI